VNSNESNPRWPAVVAVGLGIFALVTTELMPIGLLTPIASSLGISEGTAGLLVTLPGLIAAAAAPPRRSARSTGAAC
jgi:predicted MFS family arabinose efflux permease